MTRQKHPTSRPGNSSQLQGSVAVTKLGRLKSMKHPSTQGQERGSTLQAARRCYRRQRQNQASLEPDRHKPTYDSRLAFYSRLQQQCARVDRFPPTHMGVHDSGRAERHIKDYAFQRSQLRRVFLEDYEETEILETRGARMGWGVQLTIREPDLGPVGGRRIAGREILWLEQRCMDVENGFEGAGFRIVKTDA